MLARPEAIMAMLERADLTLAKEALRRAQAPLQGGVVVCDCPCHKTIEQGGAMPGDCIHCRVLG